LPQEYPNFLDVDGKRLVVAYATREVDSRSRIVISTPVKKLSSSHPAFKMLESSLLMKGYNCEISQFGRVTVVLPIRDQYGWILREIAKTFWLALTEAGYTTKMIREATRQ
jgi:hypothetical protein